MLMISLRMLMIKKMKVEIFLDVKVTPDKRINMKVMLVAPVVRIILVNIFLILMLVYQNNKK